MIRRAEAIRAAWTIHWPRWPSPKIATLEPCLHPGDVEHAADARGDATPEQRQPLVGQIGLDGEHLAGGDVHDLGVAADVAGGADRLAAAAVGDVGPDAAAVKRLRALVGAADGAVEAHAALRRAGHDHAVADRDVVDRGPHLHHLAHRGVAEDRRRDLEQVPRQLTQSVEQNGDAPVRTSTRPGAGSR
jgi:hypothetical protein